jgi:hypothetical protein
VMVTLAAYCLATGLDMHEAGETELARIWTKVEVIRAKQASKRGLHTPLPIPVESLGRDADDGVEALALAVGAVIGYERKGGPIAEAAFSRGQLHEFARRLRPQVDEAMVERRARAFLAREYERDGFMAFGADLRDGPLLDKDSAKAVRAICAAAQQIATCNQPLQVQPAHAPASNGSTEPCDAPDGFAPCACGAWHVQPEAQAGADDEPADVACWQHRPGAVCPWPESCKSNGCSAVERELFPDAQPKPAEGGAVDPSLAESFERWARLQFTGAEVFSRIEGRPNGWEYNGDKVQAAWAGWQACAAAFAPAGSGEAVAWMTHHDEPMLFPTREECADYCDDDEQPIPLYAGAAPAVDAEVRNYAMAALSVFERMAETSAVIEGVNVAAMVERGRRLSGAKGGG